MAEQRIDVAQEIHEQSIDVLRTGAEQNIEIGSEPSVLHGIDGVSPIATVTQTETGATISITDRDGTTTATITNGQDGERGPQGERGERGEQGPKGDQGEQGIQGIQGEKGAKGDKGDKGDRGEKGAIGATGATGATGPQGPKGDAGQNGTNGKDGKDGADGFSPIANVTKSGDTATITITDKNGTTTAQVKDGSGADMVILSYGNSTWADFIAAYQTNSIVYCRASSNSNPATGSQTRLAFMAYVNSAENPTSVEFQYVRSVSTKSDSQQGDQVFVYTLTNAGAWTVTTRNSFSKVVAGSNMTSSYSNGAITLNADSQTDNNFTTAYKNRLDTLTDSYIIGLIQDGTEVSY